MVLRKHGASGLSIALAALSVALAFGCGGGEDGSSRDVLARGSVPPASPLQERFAVFRGPRVAADEVPPSLLPRKIADQVGLDLSASRLARRYQGNAVYLVSSADLVCTYSRSNEVGNCWPIPTVESGLATATSICGLGAGADEIVTYGIVPDGVMEVTIPREQEPDRTVAVAGNVYVAATSARPPLPLRLTFVEDGRRVVRPTGIPPDLARKGCGSGG